MGFGSLLHGHDKRMRTTLYFFKEAFRGFYQAKLMTSVAIVTIGFALFLLGVIAVTYLNVRLWLKDASNRVEAVAFVKDSVASDSAAVERLLVEIRKCRHVAKIQYVDKKAAWERFKEAYGSAMLDAVDDNPFPASVEISLNEKSQSLSVTADFQKEIEAMEGIEDLRISQQWVTFLQRFRAYFLMASVFIGLLLIVALHSMITNTIKLTIYARKELVHNMHFVGATNTYIKMPFILEGILQGIIGGVISNVILWLVKMAVASRLHLAWGPWYSFLIIFAVGALFGCIGSMSAVRKFLV
jgi:cell division transport system permease protein